MASPGDDNKMCQLGDWMIAAHLETAYDAVESYIGRGILVGGCEGCWSIGVDC